MMRWKDFFYYSKSERRSIVVLLVLIVLVVTLTYLIPSRSAIPTSDETFEKEYTAFLSSLKEQKRERETKYTNRSQAPIVILAPFDPNTTDSIGFRQLGLPSWMARNILRYRAKGGMFRRPEDFKKVYGLTEEQYATLLPYLCIGESSTHRDTLHLYERQPKKDSLQFFKYPVGTIVWLNQADTTELKKIPGIGSALARMIVGYRKQLGGFYRIEQLGEIHLKVDSLRSWLSIEPHKTQRMNLNKASVERLNAHPYFNFYQAKVIVEYRKKKGGLKSLSQLKLYDEFTNRDFERMAPYVCFE